MLCFSLKALLIVDVLLNSWKNPLALGTLCSLSLPVYASMARNMISSTLFQGSSLSPGGQDGLSKELLA
jgi:hypothetical protein